MHPPLFPARAVHLLTAASVLVFSGGSRLVAAKSWVYFGDAQMDSHASIYVSSFDQETGEIGDPLPAAPNWNPVFLDYAPSHRTLYVIAGEPAPNKLPRARLKAYRVDGATGRLDPLSDVATGGPEPCHILVAPGEHSLLLANYLGGYVEIYALRADGSIGERTAIARHSGTGPVASRQEGPHAHCVNLDPSGRFLVSNDLGCDKIYVSRFDAASGTLTPGDPPYVLSSPGSGPRHFAFHPNGRFGYAITELSSTVVAYAWNGAHGRLTPIQSVSLLSPSFQGKNLSAEVLVDRQGRFLYASNRGEDSLVVFSIDPVTGRLSFVQRLRDGISLPRTFVLDPSGRWLLAANTGADNVSVCRVDEETGRLRWTGGRARVAKPLCVLFVP